MMTEKPLAGLLSQGDSVCLEGKERRFKKLTLLYVDDEEDQIYLFQRNLEMYFKVLTARGGREGLEILKKKGDSIAVVVTDQEMEGMKGIEFLREAKKMAPQVPRIMLTAYSSEALAKLAVNEGQVDYFFDKPLSGRFAEFMKALEEGIERSTFQRIQRRQWEGMRERMMGRKMMGEKDFTAELLRERLRVVLGLSQVMDKPFLALEGYFEMLKGEVAIYEEGIDRFTEVEAKERLARVWNLTRKMKPSMEQMKEELETLHRFIGDCWGGMESRGRAGS